LLTVSPDANPSGGGTNTHAATVIGVHVCDERYPNVQSRLQALRESRQIKLTEINVPFLSQGSQPIAAIAQRRGLFFLAKALRAAFAHVRLLIRYLSSGARRTSVYVPYPGVLVVLLIGLFPKWLRPRKIVLDAFISLYDTAVEDRALISPRHRIARLIRSLESKAYKQADIVLVDTQENAEYFVHTFGTPRERIRALPLAIDERAFSQARYPNNRRPVRVLFVGTFVPLQGVEVIAQSAVALSSRDDIKFRIIGSGQTAPEVERILNRCSNTEWIKTWLGSDDLAHEIAEADICLGIFGRTTKTQRVWPLKNYLYMATGRPLITGDTVMARTLSVSHVNPAFLTVPVNDSAALANAIVQLADAPDLRANLAQESRSFFEQHLSRARTDMELTTLLVT
jgi:glycosyltransferase involved in cell wall biosynthesis